MRGSLKIESITRSPVSCLPFISLFCKILSALVLMPACAFAITSLRVVMDDNYPPYAFKDQQGTLKGITIDQWRLWEKKTGISVELSGLDWGEALRRMQSGEFDVIDTIFRTNNRERSFVFTRPYARLDVPLFFHGDLSGISGAKDLQGFLIAAKTGDNAITILRQNGISSIVEYPSYEKIVEAARDGQIKVFTVDRPPALYFLNKMGIQNRFRETAPLYSGEFHRAVARGNERLLSIVEKGFADITPAEYLEIDRKWFGTPVSGASLKYLGWVAAAVAAVIVLLAAWSLTLKRAVRRRTAELAESEQRFSTIFDSVNDAIFIHDIDTGAILDINRRMLEMYGMTRDEALRATVSDISSGTNPYTQEQALAFLARAAEGQSQLFDWHTRHKDGHLFWVEVNMRRATIGTADRILVTVRDITDRKRTEEERIALETRLQQAQKMESVGRLAGGVAHDFNNMLGVILGHAELGLRHSEPGHRVHSDLLEISSAAQRSAELTRQLLAFARKQTIIPKVLNLNDAVPGMLKMLQRLIGEDISLAWHPGANLWAVRIDTSQLDQILANLCVNARDAMEHGGRITIETANCRIDDTFCADHADAIPGEYVRFSVSDTGHGMGQETLAHIFEPFFTTKELGKGTGLGLATVFGAVKQNHGFIGVSSKQSRGTTFSVYLPRYDENGVWMEPEKTKGGIPGGDETVLLVEDDRGILNMASELLEMMGYTVLKAPTPGKAIQLAQEYEGKIHLLLTDVIMPEMNGRELVKYVRPYCTGIRVLFMSGYSADVIGHHGVLEAGVHFIQKPFNMSLLADSVREALA